MHCSHSVIDTSPEPIHYGTEIDAGSKRSRDELMFLVELLVNMGVKTEVPAAYPELHDVYYCAECGKDSIRLSKAGAGMDDTIVEMRHRALRTARVLFRQRSNGYARVGTSA